MDLSFTYWLVRVFQTVQFHTLHIMQAINAENVILNAQRVPTFTTALHAMLLFIYCHSIVKIKLDVSPNALLDFGQIRQYAKAVTRIVKAVMVLLSISA